MAAMAVIKRASEVKVAAADVYSEIRRNQLCRYRRLSIVEINLTT